MYCKFLWIREHKTSEPMRFNKYVILTLNIIMEILIAYKLLNNFLIITYTYNYRVLFYYSLNILLKLKLTMQLFISNSFY